MPAFGDVLSDSEIRSILAFIKSRWPEPIRALQPEAPSPGDAVPPKEAPDTPGARAAAPEPPPRAPSGGRGPQYAYAAGSLCSSLCGLRCGGPRGAPT